MSNWKFFDAGAAVQSQPRPATSISASPRDFHRRGLYNLAGKGTLKVIGGMSREGRLSPDRLFRQQQCLRCGPMKTPKDLAGKRVAVTQVGSKLPLFAQAARRQILASSSPR